MKKIIIMLVLTVTTELAVAGVCFIQVFGSVDCLNGGTHECMLTYKRPSGLFNSKIKGIEHAMPEETVSLVPETC